MALNILVCINRLETMFQKLMLKNKKLYDLFLKPSKNNLIASSISIGRGGIGVALAKTSIGGKLGVQIKLKNIPGNVYRDDYRLYSESQGRIIVSIDPKIKINLRIILKILPLL